jgi:hypothetical protein
MSGAKLTRSLASEWGLLRSWIGFAIGGPFVWVVERKNPWPAASIPPYGRLPTCLLDASRAASIANLDAVPCTASGRLSGWQSTADGLREALSWGRAPRLTR